MRTLKLALTFSLLLAMAVPALAAAKPLSPKDIKAQFGSGKPIAGVSLPGDKKYSLTLNGDGKATMTLTSDKSTKTGTWHVSKTGYCSKWGTQPEHCYDVQKNGKQYDIVDTTGKVVAHWSGS
jgi:uncharacterized membrane protein